MVVADLDPLAFDEVADHVRGYAAVEPVERVSVVSGPFVIVRDETAGPRSVARTDARVRLVSRLVDRFAVVGAVITGRSALEVRLADTAGLARVQRSVAGAVDRDLIGEVRFTGPVPAG